MGALDLIKKVKIQTLSFEKHPCKDLELVQKLHYLNGLSLVAHEDGEISEKEREYLSILLTSFDLQKEQLEELVEFAQNPDEESILELMQAFSTKEIKYNFMIDAMMLASVDGNFDAKERAVIEQYFEMFKISKNEQDALNYLYTLFYTQDGGGLFRYFTKHSYFKKELFEYLLDYYKIDFAYELKEDEKKTLELEFFRPDSESAYAVKLANAIEIAVKPINNAQFCIYINYALMQEEIELNGDDMVVDSKEKYLLFNPQNSEIVYDKKSNTFVVNPDKEKDKITGVTPIIAQRFTAWLSAYHNIKYSVTNFEYDRNNDNVDSFTVKPFDEIYSGTLDFWYVTPLARSFSLHQENIEYNYSSETTSFRVMKLLDEKSAQDGTSIGSWFNQHR